jgi:hypothetical protein
MTGEQAPAVTVNEGVRKTRLTTGVPASAAPEDEDGEEERPLPEDAEEGGGLLEDGSAEDARAPEEASADEEGSVDDVGTPEEEFWWEEDADTALEESASEEEGGLPEDREEAPSDVPDDDKPGPEVAGPEDPGSTVLAPATHAPSSQRWSPAQSASELQGWTHCPPWYTSPSGHVTQDHKANATKTAALHNRADARNHGMVSDMA